MDPFHHHKYNQLHDRQYFDHRGLESRFYQSTLRPYPLDHYKQTSTIFKPFWSKRQKNPSTRSDFMENLYLGPLGAIGVCREGHVM